MKNDLQEVENRKKSNQGHREDEFLLIGWRTKTIRALNVHGQKVSCVSTPDIDERFGQDEPVHAKIIVENPANVEDVLCGLARSNVTLSKFARVASQQEFTLVGAAQLGNTTSAALSVESAVNLRDKFVQKRLVAAAGLTVAKTMLIERTSALLEAAETTPCVVKPITGASSAHTFVVREGSTLPGIVASMTAKGLHGPWLVESFVDGEEHHVDGVVRRGVIDFLSVSKYVTNVIDVRNGTFAGSVTLDSSEYQDLYDRILNVASRALSAIGHDNGVFHIEVFVKDENITFSECAGRIGGGMTDALVKAKHGVDLHDEWARIVLDLPSGARPAPSNKCFGQGLLSAERAGRVVSIPTELELLREPGVVSARPMVGPGAYLKDPTDASDVYAGEVVVEGETAREVRLRLGNLVSWFKERVVIE